MRCVYGCLIGERYLLGPESSSASSHRHQALRRVEHRRKLLHVTPGILFITEHSSRPALQPVCQVHFTVHVFSRKKCLADSFSLLLLLHHLGTSAGINFLLSTH
ncbi:hypothetical protein GUJ93_ZPchr0004g38957 [Zizania palustris]|uniref:Uncharacterized protein n=1 Tax=Zizania palustris TaxID=103762 RepID=A0A8J5VZD1_ZIZPA|nr:hypothetical protein GUJ93_ZPchr0004g38957 [Zizania palustris]